MINYEKNLNQAQFQAVSHVDGPLLVIAGAGSGKTRTIVYRLAYLTEQGIDPASLLLLTFTRKAAQEMLHRASQLLGQGLMGVQGGTFHGFAYSVLRQFRPAWLEGRSFSVMDAADITSAVRHCKNTLMLGKGDRSFPKTQTIVGFFSKSRNKELPLDEIVRREAFHLLPHMEDLEKLNASYTTYRRTQGVLDYDDLLFELEALLQENTVAADCLRQRYQYIMVDEYQDTNRVQARLVRLLAMPSHTPNTTTQAGNVMAVGDDAQSIYAFRGADVQNIRDFPSIFPNTRIIRLEENYRSTQPILNVANALLKNAEHAYHKELFTRRLEGECVRHVTPMTDMTQAELVIRRVAELLRTYVPHDVAILFRAGFHSYHIEVGLKRAGIAFRKYGGLRFVEAAHVKDVLAYARLCINPLDMPAFARVAALHRGIGAKTMDKLYIIALAGDAKATEKAFVKFPTFLEDIRFLDAQRALPLDPQGRMQDIIAYYQKYLEVIYADDWPRRKQGLEEMCNIAANYQDLDLFLADVALESPEEDEHAENCITLSTIHSAKGLEWGAVLLIDLVEDRFPSRHAMTNPEDYEEERRLMYVACTRARHILELYTPASVYHRGERATNFVTMSPFVRELPPPLCSAVVEGYGGILRGSTAHNAEHPKRLLPPESTDDIISFTEPEPCALSPSPSPASHLPLGYCQHKIFGRGKMVKFLPPDKFQVNFPGFGLKVIMSDFLNIEI